jgi:hypothetical protein
MEIYDVCIAGGGTAGAIAAIQAGRLGAKSILIEMNGQLGGTMTSGGVSGPAYFWSPLRQIIAGIGWEIAQQCHQLGGAHIPDFRVRNPRRPSYHIGVNAPLWAILCEEACLQAKVQLHYHEVIFKVSKHDEQFWYVETVGKNCHHRFLAREIVDCTGDANVIAMLDLPRMRDEIRQPGTLEFRIGGMDHNALDADAVQGLYEQALAEGRLQHGDFCYTERPFIDYIKAGGGNLQHIFGADSSTSPLLTQANIDGHQGLLRMLRFLKTIPGCENAKITYMADYCCARDTWRIVGETTVSYDDYMNARHFPDAIAYTLYFIDVHNESGTHQEFLSPELVPTLPFGCLIPKDSERILVAGRTLSSDKLAHSALRVEASCMAMGQAAGAAAAMGALRKQPSRQVPLEELRQTLRRHHAIVP